MAYQTRPQAVFNTPLDVYSPTTTYSSFYDQGYSPRSGYDVDYSDVPRGMSNSSTINPQALYRSRDSMSSNETNTTRHGSVGSSSSSENYQPVPVLHSRSPYTSKRRSNTETYVDPKRGILVERTSNQRHFCKYEDCLDDSGNRSSVSRKADLKRHYDSVHQAPYIDCKYPRCDKRGSNGFSRKDHYKEHLRGYHCERDDEGEAPRRLRQ